MRAATQGAASDSQLSPSETTTTGKSMTSCTLKNTNAGTPAASRGGLAHTSSGSDIMTSMVGVALSRGRTSGSGYARKSTGSEASLSRARCSYRLLRSMALSDY